MHHHLSILDACRTASARAGESLEFSVRRTEGGWVLVELEPAGPTARRFFVSDTGECVPLESRELLAAS